MRASAHGLEPNGRSVSPPSPTTRWEVAHPPIEFEVDDGSMHDPRTSTRPPHPRRPDRRTPATETVDVVGRAARRRWSRRLWPAVAELGPGPLRMRWRRLAPLVEPEPEATAATRPRSMTGAGLTAAGWLREGAATSSSVSSRRPADSGRPGRGPRPSRRRPCRCTSDPRPPEPASCSRGLGPRPRFRRPRRRGRRPRPGHPTLGELVASNRTHLHAGDRGHLPALLAPCRRHARRPAGHRARRCRTRRLSSTLRRHVPGATDPTAPAGRLVRPRSPPSGPSSTRPCG